MKLVEGKTYRFKQLRELRKAESINPAGEMDYLAGTTVVACELDRDNKFRIPTLSGCKTWIINHTMLEEVCEEPKEKVVYQYLVATPTGGLTQHMTEDEALEKIAERIENGGKGTYHMYQLYQEVEPPKLDISSMIRKIADKILPKDS